jgi:hypothetical protein
MKQIFSYLIALLFPLLDSCTTGESASPDSNDVTNSSAISAGSLNEGKRSVNAHILIPPLSDQNDINVRIATSSGEEIKAAWPGWKHAMFLTSCDRGIYDVSLPEQKALRKRAASIIDPSQEYQVELLTQNNHPTDILRISKSGRTVIDASICQVHKRPMKRQMEEICQAGDYPASFFRQQKMKFPNDGNFYSSCSQQSDPTWKCPECTQDYDTWNKRHGSSN